MQAACVVLTKDLQRLREESCLLETKVKIFVSNYYKICRLLWLSYWCHNFYIDDTMLYVQLDPSLLSEMPKCITFDGDQKTSYKSIGSHNNRRDAPSLVPKYGVKRGRSKQLKGTCTSHSALVSRTTSFGLSLIVLMPKLNKGRSSPMTSVAYSQLVKETEMRIKTLKELQQTPQVINSSTKALEVHYEVCVLSFCCALIQNIA